MPADTTATSWIGLGSNLGDSRRLLRRAAALLVELSGATVEGASHLYRSRPVGEGFSGGFLNAVIGLAARQLPLELLATCRKIESALGRDRAAGPDRPIDLDILLCGGLIIEAPELRVPHPRLAARRFVLAPLAEVAPGLVHPVLGRTVAELLAALDDGQEVAATGDTLI